MAKQHDAELAEVAATRISREVSVEQQHRDVLPDHQVTWDSPEDPANPYNWPSRRKITIGIVASTSQLVTTMSASMVAPALDSILADLHMSPTAGQVAFSVFFLGLGFAPFLVAALAETYGRRPIWIAGNVFYILWNSICPVGFSPAIMIVSRLMSGCGASVGITLTAPILADMYPAKNRGKSMAIASLLPYIGPALGPIIGGVAAQNLWWPWLFWILSIFDAFWLVVGYFFIRETYTPILLQRKAKAVGQMPSKSAKEIFSAATIVGIAKEISSKVGPAIMRSIKILIRRPIIQIIALATAVEFGQYTFVLSTFASLWIKKYGQTETQASLHYIAIALGAFTCAQAGGPLMDYIWRRMKAAKPNCEPVPEYRIPYMVFSLVPSAVGVFWYAWAAEKEVHWIVVDIGVFFFEIGGFMYNQALIAYMIDEISSTRAASGNAATRILSYIFGFAFPLFAPKLYDRLGYGWGTSVLGFVTLAMTVPIPFALWFWGEKLRAIGRTAEDEKERIQVW